MTGYQKKKSMAKILSWPYIYFKKKLKIQLFIIKKQKQKDIVNFFIKQIQSILATQILIHGFKLES